ncbi:site-specific DNA-methyltransferase [Archangium lipolyticum]|uniref:site-specific DNA-methyltransferase n=1 Tax=Archangium lipolyticum TaxID=2970465 RepID=UPI002149C12F|nr:site-specific DNA-methyltransferase [Archangium lipolyticum]
MTARNYTGLSRDELIQLLEERDAEESGGLRLRYKGQTPPWRIVRTVKPRRQKLEPKLSVGSEEEQARNMIMEGENLQAMASLYKYRGQVDLILTDPPYNTGEDFRYNDKWDEDPNDPDLGALVPAEDGSRHSKWLRFMVPRLWMMREMLKPTGVLAICIDQREFFRLGIVLDEMFGETNRLAIINWQKTTPKNDASHVSATTEYVLVYAKDKNAAKTEELERSKKSNARFSNPDNDEKGEWKQDNLTARSGGPTNRYALQSPFTGEFHTSEHRFWAYKRARLKEWLEAWGPAYEDFDLGDDRGKALVLKGWGNAGTDKEREAIIAAARKKAEARLKAGNWPFLYWGHDGLQKPVRKTYKELVKTGAVPTTFWVEEDEVPVELDSVSWRADQSGRSRDGVDELTAIVGRGHKFDTVKPLRLIKKIIQIWCPKSGIVMDPFAGSGTTGHAVLELNAENEADRRFILIEQGRPERGDPYARSLTAERIRRVIKGERADKQGDLFQGAEPLPGGFRFSKLMLAVDAEAVLALKREEMLDLLLTTHWDQRERASSHLRRLPAGQHAHLFAISPRGEGFFLIWNGPDESSVLDRKAFRAIVEEAKAEKLSPPYHVYARTAIYPGPNMEFYQIPDRILEKLGFNEAIEPYTADEPKPLEDDAA